MASETCPLPMCCNCRVQRSKVKVTRATNIAQEQAILAIPLPPPPPPPVMKLAKMIWEVLFPFPGAESKVGGVKFNKQELR